MSETTLGALAEAGVLSLGDGYRTKQSELTADGFRIIRVADVRDGRISLDSPDFVSVDFERQIGSKRAVSGDVLLTTKGTVGRVAIVPESVTRAVYSPQLCWFRVSDPAVVSPRFLYYWLQSDAFLAQSSYMQGNSDMAPYISLSDLRSSKITLPPRSEQEAIAEVLGALDDKIAANTMLVASAEELVRIYAQSNAQAAEHARVSLGELSSAGVIALGDGYRTKKSELAESGFRIIRAGDIAQGTFSKGHDYVAAAYQRSIGAKSAQPRDVILTTKGTVGRVAIVPKTIGTAVYSPQICFFRVLDPSKLDWGYFASWFLGSDIQSQLSLRAYRSDMAPYVNLDDIRSIDIPYPNAAVQREFGGQVTPLFKLAEHLREESVALSATRDALLPQLMSGKLRVRAPQASASEAGA